MIGFLVRPFAMFYSRRHFLVKAVRIEIKQRYAGSIFGGGWLVLSPILMLSVYVLLYLYILRLKPPGFTPERYVLFMFCGLVPYYAMADGLAAGMGALIANKAVLRSSAFPAEILPLRSVLTSAISFAVGCLLLVVGAVLLDTATFYLLLVPVVALFLLLFVIGGAWILSLVTILLRDVQNLINFVMVAVLVISPVAFLPDSIPAALRPIVWLNPLSYYVVALQDVVVHGKLPDPQILIALSAMGIGAFAAGYHIFITARKVILEYA